jgi:hypothetical protein
MLDQDSLRVWDAARGRFFRAHRALVDALQDREGLAGAVEILHGPAALRPLNEAEDRAVWGAYDVAIAQHVLAVSLWQYAEDDATATSKLREAASAMERAVVAFKALP